MVMLDRITEFVYWNSPFNEYAERLGERFVTFRVALNVFLQNRGRTIVETGSLRSLDEGGWRGDGNSTIVFGDLVAHYGGHLWTCDLNPRAIATAQEGTAAFRTHISYVCADSRDFLAGFADPIDLLYLDSMDSSREGDCTEAQQHNLNELLIALPKVSAGGVILLDDNWYANGGKTALSKEHLRRQGWICLYDSRQTVWVAGTKG